MELLLAVDGDVHRRTDFFAKHGVQMKKTGFCRKFNTCLSILVLSDFFTSLLLYFFQPRDASVAIQERFQTIEICALNKTSLDRC